LLCFQKRLRQDFANSEMSFLMLKFVVAGPVNAGKTTFIESLSETPVIMTDEPATDGKPGEMTTVPMDFGTFHAGEVIMHLFGAPGHQRFDYMWEVLCEGATGLVLVVSGSEPRSLPFAKFILDYITSRVPVPFVVALTHVDSERSLQVEDVANYFDLDPWRVVQTDARDGEQNVEVLIRLLVLVLEQRSLGTV
jgi:signal recognition particle receptor subunit beta